MRRLSLGLLSLASLACAPAWAADAEQPADAPGATVLGALTKSLCRKDRLCCRDDAQAAGTDHAGRTMTVFRLDRQCNKKAPKWHRRDDECHPFENWLAIHEGERLVSRQLLSKECNDGYGFANEGEDRTEIDKNSFVYWRHGGSNWTWSETVRLTLDPLHVASEVTGGDWKCDHDHANLEEWSWDDLAGHGERGVSVCKQEDAKRDGGRAEQVERQAGEDEGSEGIGAKYLFIPHVALPSGFVRSGWKGIALGKCGAFVDGVEEGFSIHGESTNAADASFRVLATTEGDAQVLLVEIADDKWVGPGLASAGKSWLADDHLELWLGERIAWDGPCTTKDKGDPKQWAIRVSDGKVFAAMGKPIDRPKVERTWPAGAPGKGGLVRLKISMAWPLGTDSGVTLVYSDSDDGRRQKRLLATSTVRLGWAATLGSLRVVPPERGVCVVRDGRLAPQLLPQRWVPDQPVVPFNED
jgi:hypothetical protein